MLLDVEESQLVLVDYQIRLMPAMLDSASAIANAIRLAQLAALMQVPAFLTEQNPSKLGETVLEIRQAFDVPPRVLAKMQFSAVEEGLGEWLRPPAKPVQGNARSLPKHLQKPAAGSERGTIVLAGCEAHICVLQTALQLRESGNEVFVVEDAVISRNPANKANALSRLRQAGVIVSNTESVVFEWLKIAEGDAFKQLSKLVR